MNVSEKCVLNKMKNLILIGYGNMGSSIAKGWLLKKLNFNFLKLREIKL